MVSVGSAYGALGSVFSVETPVRVSYVVIGGVEGRRTFSETTAQGYGAGKQHGEDAEG
jgi:hypothetical protein